MTPATLPPITSEPVRVVLPERAVPGKPLGRHIYHDPRSYDYPAQRAPWLVSVRHSAPGLPLTQSDEHTCSTAHSLVAALDIAPLPLTQSDEHTCSTAHSLVAALDSAPGSPRPGRPLNEQDAVRIYEVARMLEGSDFELMAPGSSGLMACKAARRMGLIRSYEHAFGIRHALEALVLRPVMTGFAWYTSFDSPDPRTGLVEITPDAEVRGGHEVVADEIDADAGLVWFWNSWGPGYGIGGRFCMTFGTWARLLEDQGDVTVPIV
jgi:hypothetical protein